MATLQNELNARVPPLPRPPPPPSTPTGAASSTGTRPSTSAESSVHNKGHKTKNDKKVMQRCLKQRNSDPGSGVGRCLDEDFDDVTLEDSAELVTDEDMQAQLQQRLQQEQSQTQENLAAEQHHESDEPMTAPRAPPQTSEDHFWGAA